MPYTISRNPNGKSRIILDIPDASSLDLTTISLTDVTTGTTSQYVFTLSGSVFLPQPGTPCRLIITTLTTTVVATTAGQIRVQFQYHDLSNQVVPYDSGALAADFVTTETLSNQTPTGPSQTLLSNVGGEQPFVVPVAGLCSVKSGVVTGPGGDIWDIVLSGQRPDSLWTKVVYRFPEASAAKAATAATAAQAAAAATAAIGTLSVTLTTEDNVPRCTRGFYVRVFRVDDDGT